MGNRGQAMPLTPFQARVARLLAVNRTPGLEGQYLPHVDRDLKGSEAVILPGAPAQRHQNPSQHILQALSVRARGPRP